MVAPEWSEGERGETSRNGGATMPAAAPAGKAPSAANPEVDSKAIRRTRRGRSRVLGISAAAFRQQELISSEKQTGRQLWKSGLT
jgi:hypothetical protein